MDGDNQQIAKWKATFDAFLKKAYPGQNKRDKLYIKKYKNMRNGIAKAVASEPWPQTIDAPSSLTDVERDDPLAWASYLQAPIIISLHQPTHVPDGDLGNQFWRRCKVHPDQWRPEGPNSVIVVRQSETTGYRPLATAWPLAIVALSAPRTDQPSFAVTTTYNLTVKRLVSHLQSCNTNSNLVVLNGLPFYNMSKSLDFKHESYWMHWLSQRKELSWSESTLKKPKRHYSRSIAVRIQKRGYSNLSLTNFGTG